MVRPGRRRVSRSRREIQRVALHVDGGLQAECVGPLLLPESNQHVDGYLGRGTGCGRQSHDGGCDGDSSESAHARTHAVGGGEPNQLPTIKRTLEAHEESKKNTVGGRWPGWLQRAALSLGKLLGSKAVGSMEAVINGTFDQILEAYRQLVQDARMPCLVPAGYFGVLTERLRTPHELGENGQRIRTEREAQYETRD